MGRLASCEPPLLVPSSSRCRSTHAASAFWAFTAAARSTTTLPTSLSCHACLSRSQMIHR